MSKLGAKVSGTIRKGIVNPMHFADDPLILMFGYVSALTGCCIWLIVATILNLPVSGTHSIVGATIGMAIVSKGFGVIVWTEVSKIGNYGLIQYFKKRYFLSIGPYYLSYFVVCLACTIRYCITAFVYSH